MEQGNTEFEGKVGFYKTTPIIQPSGNILTALSNLGLIVTPSLASSDITTALGYTPVNSIKSGYFAK